MLAFVLKYCRWILYCPWTAPTTGSQDEWVRLAQPTVDSAQPSEVLGFAARVEPSRGHGSTNQPTCTYCCKPGYDALVCCSKLECTHCKKIGHEVHSCCELVGYPKDWPNNSRPTARGGACTPLPEVAVLQRHMSWPPHL